MTVAIVQARANLIYDNNASGATIHTGTNFTAGNTVFFICSSWGGGFASVTINGVAATKDRELDQGGGDTISIWRLNSVTGGNDTVALGAGASYMIGAIVEVSGLAGGAPETAGTNTGSSNNPNVTASAATTTADSFVLAGWSNGGDGSHSTACATGYTMAYSTGGGEGGGGAYKIVASTGTQSASFTGGGNVGWAAAIASYAGTGGGGGVETGLSMGNPTLLF